MVQALAPDPYRFGERIEQVIAHHARREPAAPALQQGDEIHTYAELTARAARIAGSLRERGVGAGDTVPVLLERSCDLVFVLLGILSTGAAYIAMDSRWPRQRIDDVVAGSGARLVIAEDGSGLPDVPVASPGQLMSGEPGPALPPLTDGAAGACVFYTSGSTGRPKGVLAPHRGVIRTLVDVPGLPMSSGTVMLQAAPLPWDGFALELWAALLNGGRCVLLDAGLTVLDPDALRAAIGRGVNTLFLTTALFAVLSDEAPELFDSVRLLMVGGERVTPAHVRRVLRRCPGIRFVHCYGPAESTIFTTVHPVRDGDVDESAEDIPLGSPVPYTGVVLLDEAGAVTGSRGEIAISGDGLALGYLGDPEETRRRFVHIDGVRHYRTGDLAVRDDEGRLRYRGRLDRQIKINGVRIEPGEVDAVLASHPAVGAAYTVLVEPRAGRRALASVYTTRTGAHAEPGTLREFAARRLLPAMLPEVIVEVPALPLGSTGKTDEAAVRRTVLAVLQAEPNGSAGEPGEPGDELLTLVREALGLPRLSRHDDFLDAGATSLDVMRLCARLQSRRGVRTSMAEVYRRRRTVEQLRPLVATVAPPAAPAGRPAADLLPLSPAQLRFWMAEQFTPGGMDSMIQLGYVVDGPLDSALLDAAWADVVARHPALRTVYPVREDTPVQQRLPPGARPPIEAIAVAGPDASTDPVTLAARLAEPWWHEPLDLTATPPVRVRLARLSATRHLLFVQVHHICFDGWSESVLLTDLAAAYTRRHDGRPADAPVFADLPYAGDVTDEIAELPYWRGQLDPARPPMLPLAGPAASPAPRHEAVFAVPAERVDRLRAAVGEHGGPLSAALLTATGRALHHTLGVTDAVLGTTSAGRGTEDSQTAIGYFVNPLAVPLHGLDRPARQLIGTAVTAVLGALDHARTPFDELVRQLKPRRDRHPFFQTWTVLQWAAGSLALGPEVTLTPVRLRQPLTAMELVVEAIPDGGGWEVAVQWRADGISGDTGRRLAAAVDAALTELCEPARVEVTSA